MMKKIIALFLVGLVPLYCACSSANGGGGTTSPIEQEETPANEFQLTDEAYSNLPLIKINIENNGFPTDKENYLNCSFDMTNTENGEYDLSVEMGGVGIRLRGNSTMNMAKKPFRIKFDKKQSLFGLQKNKSWVLLADYLDQSAMRNYTAMKIANEIYDGFSTTGTHVVLVVNGKYQGVYLLCEQINENAGRTGVKSDIDPATQDEFPFLVEMDHCTVDNINDLSTFHFEDLWEPLEIKYPEEGDRFPESDTDVLTSEEKAMLSKNVYDYIKEYVWASLYTLKYGGAVAVSFSETEVSFTDLVDEESYLTYILINEIMGNGDNMWKSIYMYKTATGKLKFGPVWDFDWACSNGWTGQPYAEMTEKYAKGFTLIREGKLQGGYLISEERYNKLTEKFNSIKMSVRDIVMDLPDYYSSVRTAIAIDAVYWYGDNGAYLADSQFAGVRLYILDKIDYLDEQFSKTYTEFVG